MPAYLVEGIWTIIKPLEKGIRTGSIAVSTTIDMGEESSDTLIKLFQIAATRPTHFQLIGNTLSWDAVPEATGYVLTYAISFDNQSATESTLTGTLKLPSEVTSLDISNLPSNQYGTATIQSEFADGRISDPTPIVVADFGTDSGSGQEFQSGDIGGTFWTARPITNFDGFRGEIFAYERQFEESVQDIDVFSIELQKGQVLVVDIDAKVSGAFQSHDGMPVGNAKIDDFSYTPVFGLPTGFPSNLSVELKVYYGSDEGMIFIEPLVNKDSDYQGDPYREYQAQTSGTYYIFIYGKEDTEGNYIFYKEVTETPQTQPTPGEVFRDTLQDGSLGPEMVWIPAGTFRMGDIQGDGDSSENEVVSIFLTAPV